MDRRHLLLALASLGAAAALPAAGQGPSPLTGIDPAAAARIGKAWLVRNRADAATLRRRLVPRGWSPAAVEALRRKVSEDFQAGRVFIHRGWRLSDTEGALFALLALTPV